MKRLHYDFVFSIGAMCSCSSALRRGGLQYASYPFDWILGSDLVGRAKMVASEFEGWLEEKDLEIVDSELNRDHVECRNNKTGIVFVHDFPRGKAVGDVFSEVRAKYERRCRRLVRRCSLSKRILAVYMNSPAYTSPTDDEMLRAHSILAEKFPEANITLLVMVCRKGISFERRVKREISDGVILYAYDYEALEKSFDTNAVERSKVDALFDLLRISAEDYRSEEERRAHKLSCRMKRYARFGATSFWGYALTRLEYRIFRHLQKHLVRKGVQLEDRR